MRSSHAPVFVPHVLQGTRVVLLNQQPPVAGFISEVRREPYLRTYVVTCDDGRIVYHPGMPADLSRPGLESGMALVRGRPWEQSRAGRHTEELLLRHPIRDARALAIARWHHAAGLYFQGEIHGLHRCWG